MDETLKSALVAALSALTAGDGVSLSDKTLEQYVDQNWDRVIGSSVQGFLKHARKELVGVTDPVVFLPDGSPDFPTAHRYTRVRLNGMGGELLTRLPPMRTIHYMLEQGWVKTAQALAAYYAKHHPHG